MIVNLLYSKKFRKHYQKRILNNSTLDRRAHERINFFVNNPLHPLLQDHSLKGSREGSRAFSITGDIRIIYQWIDEDSVELLDIGTHNQVYH